MKKTIALFLFSLLCLSLSAQISVGGLPPSFTMNNRKSLTELKLYKVEVKENISKLKREDSLLVGKNVPLRVTTIIPVAYDLVKDGEWTTLENEERICRLSIKSPDALGIILTYSDFYIPRGGKLFIYGKDGYQLLGAYTYGTNPKGKEFSTEIVYGEELTLEYVAPNVGEVPRIKITNIGYGYNNIYDYTKEDVQGPGFKASGSCQVNINCEEGDNWQIQKKGIARTYTQIGKSGYLCSGSLINNIKEDRTGFYLSAYHCFFDSGNTANFNTAQFYFNYEFSGCDNEKDRPENVRTIVGAQLLVANPIDDGSDGILLKLNDEIPEYYDVYFNGWDISNTPAASGVCIHHPAGDVKKISTYAGPLTTGSYSDFSNISTPNAHWMTQFIQTRNGHGTTEGGSSGSPLFNQHGLIVGTLTGGSSSCTSKNGTDYFGKMYYHWNQHSNSGYHMQPYLDPTNRVQRLNGLSNIPIGVSEDAPAIFAYWDNNQSKSSLIVRIKDDTDALQKVTIVNLRGYDAFRKNNFSGAYFFSIPTENWTRGVYIVHIESVKGVKHSFKIIK